MAERGELRIGVGIGMRAGLGSGPWSEEGAEMTTAMGRV